MYINGIEAGTMKGRRHFNLAVNTLLPQDCDLRPHTGRNQGGRDIVIERAQAGEPLNYFVNPYVEVSGAPHSGVSKEATWRDLP